MFKFFTAKNFVQKKCSDKKFARKSKRGRKCHKRVFLLVKPISFGSPSKTFINANLATQKIRHKKVRLAFKLSHHVNVCFISAVLLY